MNLKEHYSYKKKEIETEIKKLRSTSARFSFFRLCVFIFGFVQLFFIFPIFNLLSIFIAVLSLLILILLIVKHGQLQFQLKLNEIKKQNYSKELKAIDHNFEDFDAGNEFDDANHGFAYDIDFFAKQGFFQSLNRCENHTAKRILKDFLILPNKKKEEIVKRQKTITELSNLQDLSHEYLAYSKIGLSEVNDEHIIRSLSEDNFFIKKRSINILRFVLPGLTILTLLLYALQIINQSLPITIIVLQLSYLGLYFRKINKIHQDTSNQHYQFVNYVHLIKLIGAQKFQSEELISLNSKVNEGDDSAYTALKNLSLILKRIDYRLNLLVGFILNAIFLWDFHCMIKLEKWKNKHKHKLKEWIDTLHSFESLISLGRYKFNHPAFTFPKINPNAIFQSESLGHPLIEPEKRICNDFKINEEGGFTIVTGANMAGKSTFLRTVGLSMVMAYAGLPVCAKKLELSVFELYTSMRTNDSLSKNESYFYAELKRLKDLLDKINKKERLFVILDEILKGTNSKDKQEGSLLFLSKLIQTNTTGIIATHDLQLAKIEEHFPEKIQNKCFEIELNGAEISFDYKLYNGITQKMNASLLMKQMGII